MTRCRLIIALACTVPGAAGAQSVAEVQVAPPSVTVRVGERSSLLATAFDRIGNVIPTVRIIWSSNNVGIAKVDNNGTVTGVANGVAIIEARVGARRGQAAVQVTGGGPAPPPPAPPAAPPPAAPPGPDPFVGQPAGSGPAAALRLEPGVVYLLPSENSRISPRALREDGSPAAPTVAGLLQSKSFDVAVHKVVDKLAVTPRASAEVQVPLTGTAKFKADALTADNTAVPEAPLRWSVADPTIASFDVQTGLLTGRAVGKTQLTVRGPGAGLAVTWNVSVIAGAVKFTQPRVGIGLNQRHTLRANYADDQGNVLGPASNLTWSSDNAQIATVGEDGTVSGV